MSDAHFRIIDFFAFSCFPSFPSRFFFSLFVGCVVTCAHISVICLFSFLSLSFTSSLHPLIALLSLLSFFPSPLSFSPSFLLVCIRSIMSGNHLPRLLSFFSPLFLPSLLLLSSSPIRAHKGRTSDRTLPLVRSIASAVADTLTTHTHAHTHTELDGLSGRDRTATELFTCQGRSNLTTNPNISNKT